jgi:Xaa-Pro aminopeptidase
LTGSSAEANVKRALAVEAAEAAGSVAVVATSPPTVRWLLCGRGRPVSTSGPEADYTVVLAGGRSAVLFPDIEASRVEAEERFEELGYEPVPFPWHEGLDGAVATLVDGAPVLAGEALEGALAPARRTLAEPERERFRVAGAAAAGAMVQTLGRLSSEDSEEDVAAELALQCRRRGFFPPVVLVAGAERQGVHRHPLPTGAALGRHALLAVTAEREGLHVSLTRLVSFGSPPAELERLVRLTAEVDAAVLGASRPGRTLGEVFEVLDEAYSRLGFPGEWRRHHQGGLTGYKGREVFAVPGEPTPIPESSAVAWNPSITGGAKSEDTALASGDGMEVITRTPGLPEIDVDGLARPGIVPLG